LSPILVRPVREQLEHDRVIRLLQAKYKRKFEVSINPGNEQNASVLVGNSPWFPDLLLYSQDRGRKLLGTVEVETAESVNNLEAMSQWKNFAQQKAPFHLYVPASSIDTARRMATDMQIPVAEIWAYSAIGDQLRFTMVHRSAAAEKAEKAARAAAPEPKPRPAAPAPKAAAAPRPAAPASRPAAAAARAGANGGSRSSRPATPARPPARRPTAGAAKTAARRKPAASTRTAAAKPAARRAAAKKPAARAQKRK
jgi:hypothetical protein